MGNSELSKLSVLVIDDFSSFRSTIMGMLNKLGIKAIQEASRGQEALKLVREHKFDLVLCDYNLGSGRNGQQLLEEMRFKNWIPSSTLFFMVTAEASKEMVLSAYDCEPDDYLMKPLNLRVLEQRVSRLVQQREALKPVTTQLASGDTRKAVQELETLVTQPGRHNLIAQKKLGELYLSNGHWQKAEKLYTKVLETRRLDWAVLGMAKVLAQKGEADQALNMLDQLIQDSRLYLPAYDELAVIHENKGDLEAVQEDLERVTSISPRSILRQRKLATVASSNGDILKTMKASQEAMRLGEHSCFKDVSDNLKFLEAIGNAAEMRILPEHIDPIEESKKCLELLNASHSLNVDVEAQAKLLAARVYVLEGKNDEAARLAEQEEQLFHGRKSPSLDRDLARVNFYNTCGNFKDADNLVNELLDRYRDSPEALSQLDKLLPEPQSDDNRRQVARLNKLGIEAYQQGAFNEAMAFFYRAAIVFPRHVGIQLNQLQTLVGKIKLFPDSKPLQEELERKLNKVSSILTDSSSQHFARFTKLREKAVKALKTTHK